MESNLESYKLVNVEFFSNSIHFPTRLSGTITSGTREKGCSTGSFWEVVSGKEVEV